MPKVGTSKINTEKINVIEKYKLSEKVEYCKKCVVSCQSALTGEESVCLARIFSSVDLLIMSLRMVSNRFN